ncbi:hypothetical protein OG426_18445 [Streptomyces canus]|uniref:hypothetical protein n=1 Tax=Streptomyces canus TaxID=58343 RepID=UPI00224E62BB|nr:hypothetical protein [Streptomyces canus]MCX4860477.1 hypothetical protein [Streptomyces canus]WSW34324.1 hypothetical protein OG426_18445 [Streptomyces canus]
MAYSSRRQRATTRADSAPVITPTSPPRPNGRQSDLTADGGRGRVLVAIPR